MFTCFSVIHGRYFIFLVYVFSNVHGSQMQMSGFWEFILLQ